MKGQFMLISAIVISITVISASTALNQAQNLNVDNPDMAYTLEEIKEEADKIDVADRDQRRSFTQSVSEIEGYESEVDYISSENCMDVKLIGPEERYQLDCIGDN